ncbi:delta-aminolevulinic acid dehydratase [Striga asiatica]|uniref:Delta-aminolevulinic acid dehydratase n=1 Tax=Striga asiatica TaxID=4170 RepID=A0A5A7RCV5_STRAF|nr:delta-aminolevulinic acid dehydratase [Striga asiatica]
MKIIQKFGFGNDIHDQEINIVINIGQPQQILATFTFPPKTEDADGITMDEDDAPIKKVLHLHFGEQWNEVNGNKNDMKLCCLCDYTDHRNHPAHGGTTGQEFTATDESNINNLANVFVE